MKYLQRLAAHHNKELSAFFCHRSERQMTKMNFVSAASRSTTGVLSYKTSPIALMAFLTLGSILIAAAPARAESYPVCLAGGENNALQCEYANLEQCRATASGGLGYCVMNPAYTSSAYARYNGAAQGKNFHRKCH
jgi:hypothetical protein